MGDKSGSVDKNFVMRGDSHEEAFDARRGHPINRESAVMTLKYADAYCGRKCGRKIPNTAVCPLTQLKKGAIIYEEHHQKDRHNYRHHRYGSHTGSADDSGGQGKT